MIDFVVKGSWVSCFERMDLIHGISEWRSVVSASCSVTV